MPVYENEVLGFFFNPLGTEKVELSRHLGPEMTNNLRHGLVEALVDSDDPALVESSEAAIDVPPAFKSILFERGRSDDRRKVIAFSFKDGFTDSALPLLGILVAVFGGPLTLASAVASLGVVKTLWQKLVILRAPQDTHAIRLLDALGRVGAANLTGSRKAAPRWQDVVAASKLDAKDALTALKVLRGKAIVEIESWGGQAEDLENLANCWKVRF
jgi:hypothetical protein